MRIRTLICFGGLLLPACSTQATPSDAPAAASLRAVAQIKPASGSAVTGTVTFRQVAGGVEVHAKIEHLSPGPHGFHVHEHGDCSAPDAMSAGAHWNPAGQPHGDRLAAVRHAGDLGNVVANGSGVVNTTFTDSQLALSGPHSILGLAILVHERADDFKTQPGGDAGNRIGCGVITAQE